MMDIDELIAQLSARIDVVEKKNEDLAKKLEDVEKKHEDLDKKHEDVEKKNEDLTCKVLEMESEALNREIDRELDEVHERKAAAEADCAPKKIKLEKPFLFISLPPEIRNMIYRLALVSICYVETPLLEKMGRDR